MKTMKMKRIEILKKLEELDAENKKDYELFRKLTDKEDNKTIHYEFVENKGRTKSLLE